MTEKPLSRVANKVCMYLCKSSVARFLYSYCNLEQDRTGLKQLSHIFISFVNRSYTSMKSLSNASKRK